MPKEKDGRGRMFKLIISEDARNQREAISFLCTILMSEIVLAVTGTFSGVALAPSGKEGAK